MEKGMHYWSLENSVDIFAHSVGAHDIAPKWQEFSYSTTVKSYWAGNNVPLPNSRMSNLNEIVELLFGIYNLQ